MMLLGITFFTFANQEHTSAEYYSDSAKVFSVTADVDALWDWALEQLIIGPRDNNMQSVLWPGEHSLIPNMIGFFAANPNGTQYTTVPNDKHPFNGGAGIHIIAGPHGQPVLDQDFNGGTPSANNNSNLLILNWSPVTGNKGFNITSRSNFFSLNYLPARDVGYTYPDINNVFLAHIGNLSYGSASAPTIFPIYTPSFHRPQYLRDSNGQPFKNNQPPNGNWYDDNSGGATDTTARVLRPHPAHYFLNADGTSSGYTRFLQTTQTVGSHTYLPFTFSTFGDQGIWSNSTSTTSIGYDCDNDGDGIREGIWLDLNYPASVLTDGRISIPLFSYTVIDADALVNLNYSGNLSGFTSLSYPFTGGALTAMPGSYTPVSRSNLGVSPREINPLWPMTADPNNTNFLSPTNLSSPSLTLQQYRGFFQINSPASFVPDRVEVGNMDMLFLLWGRPTYTVTAAGGNETFALNNVTPGLWGEQTALHYAVTASIPYNPLNFPRPGQPNVDDNNDQYAGVSDVGDLGAYLANNFNNGPLFSAIPPFLQPLDYYGAGDWTTIPNGGVFPNNGLIPNLTGVNTASLGYNSYARYLLYTGYQPQFNPNPPPQFGANASALYDTTGLYNGTFNGMSQWVAGYQAAMHSNWLSVSPYMFPNLPGNVDEGYEVVGDSRYQQASDQIFPRDETAALQLADTDFARILGQSRVKTLASFNFDLNQQAATIRKRFTTESADRKNHEWVYNNLRSWEYGVNGTLVNDWDSSGGNQFPPRVLSTPLAGLAPATTNSNGSAEPFRLEVAAAIGAKVHNGALNYNNAFNTPPYNLTTFNAAMSPWNQQLRLNVNRFTAVVDDSQAPGASNPLQFRQLTPHPTLTQWNNAASGNGATAIGSAGSGGSFHIDSQNFASHPALQEYWARRDRQMLARDIYVMLYLFGGGDDTQNYATTANSVTGNDPGDPSNTLKLRTLYSDRQLAEMAQFAVNYVDALDRDDTITMFEYDKDLSSGWNLDDNPITADGAGNRSVVFGVEAQQLAFNEALVIVSRMVKGYLPPNPPKDHLATMFDDSKQDRTFAYLELQNVAPYPVPLNNLNWQIMLMDPSQSAGTLNPNSSLGLKLLTINDFNNQSVSPGLTYTIGTRTYIPGTDDVNSKPFPSTFVVDPNWNNGLANPDPAFQTAAQSQMAPASSATLNLDLVTQANQSGTPTPANQAFMVTDGGFNLDPTVGDFVNFGADVTLGPFGNPGNGSTPYTTTFVLRRRLNINRPAPQIGTGSFQATDDADNPWVEVDRIVYVNALAIIEPPTTSVANANLPGGFFCLRDPNDSSITSGGGTVATNDIQPKLQRLTSKERKQPLDGYDAGNSPAPVTAPVGLPTYTTHVNFYPYPNAGPPSTFMPNTLGNTNFVTQNTGGLSNGFTLWQPHFDRDFASVMELLSIPLYSPSVLTQCLAPKDKTNFNSLAVETPLPPSASPGAAGIYQPLIAQAKFFRPQHPQNQGAQAGMLATNPQIDNRWHRIFELLEVPTRENLQVENYLLTNFSWLSPTGLQRVPAKMNINCLRNAENLFALFDDPSTFNPATAGYLADGSYVDRNEWNSASPRNWWQQLLTARDGLDYQVSQALGANVSVPGAPGSRPFRSFSSIDQNPKNYTSPTPPLNSVDDTLLRALPLDAGVGLEQRRLFEARSQTDFASSATGNTVDYYTRQRLLAKIAGNTTNRSNVFIVWISVGFFEGYQPDPVNSPGVIQVGAQMADQPPRRGFFIVDRTLLEDAWNPTTGTYDFRKFVQYRKTIQ